MRISNIAADPGYCRDLSRFSVSFNGDIVPPRDIIIADESTGLLVRIKRDGHGVVTRNGDPVTVIERGKLRIRERSNVVIARPAEVPFA